MGKNIGDLLHRLYREQLSFFWVGAIGGAPVSFAVLLSINVGWHSVVFVVLFKAWGGILLSFLTGISTSLASDVYKHKMKHKVDRILKPKIRRNGKQDDNERAA